MNRLAVTRGVLNHHCIAALSLLCLGAGCEPGACPVGFRLEGAGCVAIREDAGGDDSGAPDAGLSDAGPSTERCDDIDSDQDRLVDIDDPDAHEWCAGELPPNVIARCGAEGCYEGGCQTSYLDCDEAPGCESPSTTLEHCGECDRHCAWECTGVACDDVVELSSGYEFQCALRASGTVWCWGSNADGRLGDGTTINRSTPVRVVDLTDVVEIDAGEHHACARERDGEVWCWGRNHERQLGNPISGTSPRPVLAVPSSEEVVEISAGGFFTCVRTAAGRVLCWGADSDGQIGNGPSATPYVAAPFDVGLTGIVEIALGTWHACARRDSGAVVCWGANRSGQLGDGSTTERSSVPSDDIEGLAAVAISAGNLHTCALRDDASVVCWGANSQGELGIGSREQRHAPSELAIGLSSVAEIETGHSLSCARSSDGAVRCWGEIDFGRLGVNTSQDLVAPPSTPILSDAVEISVTGLNGCARRASGEVVCWGANNFGQIGNGTIDTSTDRTGVRMPTPVTPPQ